MVTNSQDQILKASIFNIKMTMGYIYMVSACKSASNAQQADGNKTNKARQKEWVAENARRTKSKGVASEEEYVLVVDAYAHDKCKNTCL